MGSGVGSIGRECDKLMAGVQSMSSTRPLLIEKPNYHRHVKCSSFFGKGKLVFFHWPCKEKKANHIFFLTS